MPSMPLFRLKQNELSVVVAVEGHWPALTNPHFVITGIAVWKDGVASLAYVPVIPIRVAKRPNDRDGRDKPGHDKK